MVRQELASLLWGAGLLFLIAAAVLAVRLCAAGLSGPNAPGLSLRTGTRAFAPGGPARIALVVDLPGLLLPVCRVSCAGRLESQDGRVWAWQVRLAAGRNSAEIECSAPRRGAYVGPAGFLVVEDLFGFSRAVVRLAGTEELIVYPALPAGKVLPMAARRGGETIARVDRPEYNQELLETRRYVPGDDPRRIKWKLRAHSGELFVRVGEEEPPPGTRLLVVVDTSFDERIIARTLVPFMLDRLAEAAAGIILDAHGRGLQLELGEPDGPAFIVDRPVGALAWLARLRGRPAASPETSTWPGTPEGPVRPDVLVRLPGNPRGGSADLVVIASPPAAGELADARPARARRLAERRLWTIRARLEEDLIRLRAGGGRSMSQRTERPGRWAAATALRLVSLVWLAFHWCRHFPEMVEPLPAILLLAAAWAVGIGIAATRLPAVPGLLILAVLPPLTHRLALFLAQNFRSAAETAGLRGLTVLVDQHAWLLMPALLMFALSTFAWQRFGRFRRIEPALHGLLMTMLFWNQARHRLSLYDHPALLAAAVVLFLAVNLISLALAAPGPSPAACIETGRRQPVRSLLTRILLALLLLVPLGLVLDLAYRRYVESSLTAGGGLIKPGLFKFDFSDYVRLESEIRLNRDLVMLVRKTGFPDKYLLRRFVLAGYRAGGGFFQDREEPLAPAVEGVTDGPLTVRPRETYGREPVEQEVYLVNLEPDALVSLNYPVEVSPQKNWRASSFTRVYRVVSLANILLPFEFEQLADPGLSPAQLRYYTRWNGNERLRQLAEKVTAGMSGFYDRVQAIHSHLGTNYFYSLNPGTAVDGDQLSHFLFVSRKAYCSYFAFAMALMCRSLGIPARVAVGFFLDPGSQTLGYHPVRADMAHAWVEVYFGRHGWIEFDPTSRVPAPGEKFDADTGADRYSGLVEEILKNRDSMPSEDRPAAAATLAEGRPRAGGFPAPAHVAAAGLLLLLAAYGRLRWRPAFKLAFSKDPRRRTEARMELALRGLAGAGYARRPGESRPRYVRRIQLRTGLPVEALFEVYQAARFAPEYPAGLDARAAEAQVALRRSARGRISRPRRLLALVHPRSLAGGILRG